MKLSLFDENERYTYDALELDHKVSDLLRQLLYAYGAKYSIRQTAHIMRSSIDTLEAEALIPSLKSGKIDMPPDMPKCIYCEYRLAHYTGNKAGECTNADS